MSTEQKDTITVELPIEATGGELVVAAGMYLNRSDWRDAASGRRIVEWTDIIRAVAPAVVAWIERDEREPLGLPAVGRTIKATLRDGRVVEGEVRQVEDMGTYADVLTSEDAFSIDTSPKAHPDPADITAWHYVDDEPEPVTIPVTLDIPKFLDLMQATIDVYREALK